MWSEPVPKWSSSPPISSSARPSSSSTPCPSSSAVLSCPPTTVSLSAHPLAQFRIPYLVIRPLIISTKAPRTLSVQACSSYGRESRAARPRSRRCPPLNSGRESTSSGSPYGGTRRHKGAPPICWSRPSCLNPGSKSRTCHSSLTVCTVSDSRVGS